ncbi:MAG: lysylphosphatidylglycerol synthase transmembrane domain-containing protein [Chloroflexota bacterium]
MSRSLINKILYSCMFALLLYIALVLWSDWTQLVSALTDFPWLWLPVVIALTWVNYIGRLVKWNWYMGLLEVDISRWDSTRIFGIGMLMVMTPGKAGEFLKSYMVRNVSGTPMSVTAPAVLAERVTDGMAMLLLASIGLFAFPNQTARIVATIVAIGFVCGIIIIQIRPLALWFLGIGQKLPIINRIADPLYEFYESSYIIFNARNLMIALTIGVISWLAEGVAYGIVLIGFGVPFDLNTLLIAIFIFSISTVIGAVVAAPGGLGGVEGSLFTLSISILSIPAVLATAAALLIRFCTLWMGVLVGVVSFLLWSDLLAGASEASDLAES